jgi:hypothetical protein
MILYPSFIRWLLFLFYSHLPHWSPGVWLRLASQSSEILYLSSTRLLHSFFLVFTLNSHSVSMHSRTKSYVIIYFFLIFICSYCLLLCWIMFVFYKDDRYYQDVINKVMPKKYIYGDNKGHVVTFEKTFIEKQLKLRKSK